MIDTTDSKYEGPKLATDWIRDLESSDSRLHKESVIEKALMSSKLGSANAQCFLFNCYLAYNPFFVYNVKQVPETTGLVDRPNHWPKFWALCEGLRTRTLTGYAARDAIAEVSQQFDSDEWNSVCRRVLIKDFRCGISVKTLNKILANTDWAIPVFSCQLATDSSDQSSKMTGIKRLEYKLDGVRALAVVNGYSVTLMSRNGKVYDNFPHIEQAILDCCFSNGVSSKRFVLDGEIIGDSFQNLMKQARRKGDAKTTDMVYHIFDIIPLEDFSRGFCNAQQHKRLSMLNDRREQIGTSNHLKIVDGIEVNLDTEEGHAELRDYASKAIELGYEGIMIKDLNAPYSCKRTTNWLKWKPTLSVDLKVIDIEEGTGRNVGRTGALICEGTDHGKHIRVNVGSGLTDEQRDDYWKNRNLVIGSTAEILCDVITQNQNGTYSLRFPRFLRFRDDK